MTAKDCERVCGHLKRATFDSFKLIYQNEIRIPYVKFMDDKYAEVHDGDFRKEITEKWTEARRIADEARALERKSREYDTSWDAAFAKWNELLPIAEYFNGLYKDRVDIFRGQFCLRHSDMVRPVSLLKRRWKNAVEECPQRCGITSSFWKGLTISFFAVSIWTPWISSSIE